MILIRKKKSNTVSIPMTVLGGLQSKELQKKGTIVVAFQYR